MKLHVFLPVVLATFLFISGSATASENDNASVEGYIQAACTRYAKFVYFSAEQMKNNVPISSLLAFIDANISDKSDATNLKYVAAYTYKNIFVVGNENVWKQMVFNTSNSVYLKCYEGAHEGNESK